jgi:hypothetical protein
MTKGKANPLKLHGEVAPRYASAAERKGWDGIIFYLI